LCCWGLDSIAYQPGRNGIILVNCSNLAALIIFKSLPAGNLTIL
jgi:hypothetical protein